MTLTIVMLTTNDNEDA